MFEIPKFQISVFEFQISGQRQRRKNGAQRELARLNKQVEKMSQTEKKALILSSME